MENPWDLPPSVPAVKPEKSRKVLALVLGLVLFVAGGVAVFALTKSNKSVAAMSYISSSDPGPQVFMESVATPNVQSLVADKGFAAAPMGGGKVGSDPNLYGGSGDLAVCDWKTLAKNLNQDAQLKAAFAAGVGVRVEDVASYVESLKSVILMQDTWVTNHGYADGKATPYQSVLQKGTAVLVDAKGVPRVRCACGNPLAEPWDGYTAPTESTTYWEGYDWKKVVAVVESEKPAEELSVTDVESGQKSKVEISDWSRKIQQDAEDAVTSDTPVTSPKDMGVKPDKKLLDELGLPVAQGGDKRPSGIERFGPFDNMGTAAGAGETQAESQFPDWRSQTTEVAKDSFLKHVSRDTATYWVAFDGHDAFCSVYVRESKNEMYESFCQTSVLDVDLKDVVSMGGEKSDRHLDTIGLREEEPYYKAYGSEDGGPKRYVFETPPSLGPNESVKIGDVYCFNLEDRIGCENPDSKFVAVDNSGVYFNGATVPVGHVCGEAQYVETGKSFDVVVKNGAVDCDEAMDIVSQYVNSPNTGGKYGQRNIQVFGDWNCATTSPRDFELTGSSGGCRQMNAPHGQVTFVDN